jgi:hypothetical protein
MYKTDARMKILAVMLDSHPIVRFCLASMQTLASTPGLFLSHTIWIDERQALSQTLGNLLFRDFHGLSSTALRTPAES